MFTFYELVESINTLRNDLIELMDEAKKHISGENENQFVPRVELYLSDLETSFIEKLAKEAKIFTNGGWIKLEPKLYDLRERSEKLNRKFRLLAPLTIEDFRATIFWMVERGAEEDLELIRKVKKAPPFSSTEIIQLLELAEKRITERVNDPGYALKKGKDATRQNKQEWDKKPPRRFIALKQLQKLERLKGNLIQIKKLPGELWNVFAAYIYKAQQEAESENFENAFQTLESLFDELEGSFDFSIRTEAVRTRKGLLSAYEQTPVKMDESLARKRDVSDRRDSERLVEILSALVSEIQMIDESGSGQ